MPNIDGLDAGHNTHRLTIHYFIYLLIQDFTTKCVLELYLKEKKKKTPLLEIPNVKCYFTIVYLTVSLST